MGDFDPNYIRDLANHAFDVREAKAKAEAESRAAEEKQQREMDTAREQLQSEWQEKLGPAQERYPDFREKGEELIESFSDLEPAYGEYLTATLMSMDYGPDVLYYLSSNPEEAHQIVGLGPQKASIALGRLEARFADTDSETSTPKVSRKVSKAPSPPPRNRGATPSKASIAPDTDDLDAFEKLMFSKK
jgi:hypothetical protein